jgi:hypothetical protein
VFFHFYILYNVSFLGLLFWTKMIGLL